MTGRVTGIGPTSLRSAAVALGISADSYGEHIRLVARTLARWHVTLAVNGDSETTNILASAFLESSENSVLWYVQRRTKFLAPSVRSKIIVVPANGIPASLVRDADVVVCIGFGTGTALEVCLAKFESRAQVLVLRELVSNRLPKECSFDRLSYISINRLSAALASVLGPAYEEQTLTCVSPSGSNDDR